MAYVGGCARANGAHLPSQILMPWRVAAATRASSTSIQLQQRWLATSAGGSGSSGGAPVYGHVTEGAEGDTVLYMRDTGSGREYWLIGTAHISKRSADQVLQIMQRVRPDSVMVPGLPPSSIHSSIHLD